MGDIYVHAGEIGLLTKSGFLKTILGSCVSVVLFDESRGLAGLNHFLLPDASGDQVDDLRYGRTAIPKLIKALEDHGSSVCSLRAKVFGGAGMVGGLAISFDVGAKNVQVAVEFLRDHQIPIVVQDTGGVRGRHLTVNAADFSVQIRYLGANYERP